MATIFKIPGKLACLLACLVVGGVGCPRAKPVSTPEEWSHCIDWSNPKLNEAMLSAMAPATEEGHHTFRAQSQHPTGILTSLPEQPPQAGSQSTDAAGDTGAKPWESLEAIEDFLINQPDEDEGTFLSEYYNASPSSGASLISDSLQHMLDSSPTSPGLASSHSASPSMITTTTTTTTNQSKRKSPPRIELPFGSPIKDTIGPPSGSSAALPIAQLSADPRLDSIPLHSDIQSDHHQPYFDSASGPPSQGRPQKRIMRPQSQLDEPTPPGLGSVQGKEILPAEPPKTLPPQALMTFDLSLFQLVGKADYDHLQKMQIVALRQVIEACPSKSLVIPEKQFLKYCQSYNSYLHKQLHPPNRHKGMETNHAKKARKSVTKTADRTNRLTEKVKEFSEHLEFWYHRWFAYTGTYFTINPYLTHYQFLSQQQCGTIYSLYLFYVEMISSIVPRTSQSPNIASELRSAQEAFERLSKAVTKRLASEGDAQSFKNAAIEGSVGEQANHLLNEAAKKIQEQEATAVLYKTFPSLWTYLEFWINTNRPGIFTQPTSVDCKLSMTSKAFFNAVFFQSYSALHKKCLLYQQKATQSFVSEKKPIK